MNTTHTTAGGTLNFNIAPNATHGGIRETTMKLEDRMIAAIAKRIGIEVRFSHWIKSVYGDVPVFIVPDSHKQIAQENGLTVA